MGPLGGFLGWLTNTVGSAIAGAVEGAVTVQHHLRVVLTTYAAHYNTQRPHRALLLRPPRPRSPVPVPVYGKIRRRPILGGLINEYESAA